MAKRTRYSARPAGRSAVRRPGARPGPSASTGSGLTSPRSTHLTEAELDRAAALEAELVAREKAAIAENARRRARVAPTTFDAAVSGDPNQPLSVRAAHEYAYVARDVKRIVLMGLLMLGILAVLWFILNAGGGLG